MRFFGVLLCTSGIHSLKPYLSTYSVESLYEALLKKTVLLKLEWKPQAQKIFSSEKKALSCPQMQQTKMLVTCQKFGDDVERAKYL